jgi:DNA repair photolyase
MRWQGQTLFAEDDTALPGLTRLGGLVRSVTPAEFPGVRFHEVVARSVLNRVPDGSPVPFRWTVNPYRGCTHGCVYCYARGTHEWLELDSGHDFDSQIVVKVNAVERLGAELARPGWRREPVALGTNTDPYQRAEGRYRLMPGIIAALAGSGTPLSVLTKGPLLRRDLPALVAAARDVRVGLGVSVAVLDDRLRHRLEPGVPGPQARLELVRAIRDAGLPCGVMLAPVLPGLTDDEASLDAALGRIAAAGATGVSVLALHLRPGAREWYLAWLARERPDLVPRYRALYRDGAYARVEYRRRLADRVQPLLRRHGLTPQADIRPDDDDTAPSGSASSGPGREPDDGQLTLL